MCNNIQGRNKVHIYTTLAKWKKLHRLKNKLDLERSGSLWAGPDWLDDQVTMICICTDQGDSNELDLEWAHLLAAELRRPLGEAYLLDHGLPLTRMSSTGKWLYDVKHLPANKIPTNLIWIESIRWLLRYGIRKVWGLSFDPWGTPDGPNRPKMIPLNLNWGKSTRWLLSYGVCKVQAYLLSMSPTGKLPWRCKSKA